jgi:signal transduction histidine kinase
MKWPRSLYWRIALVFTLSLAAMLVVQALLLLWVASLAGPTIPGQPPERFAFNVANDLAETIERDPTVDLDEYVREQYGRATHPLFVVLANGRVISNGGGPIPQGMIDEARERLRAGPEMARGQGRGFRRERDGFRGPRPMPIIVNSTMLGVVVVPPRAPFGFLLRRFAPTLTLVSLAALFVGAGLAAIVIFGPARRRLLAMEDAARRVGAGDLSARAPAEGGDEIAAVARAFNSMAGDLATRAEALAASDRARRQLLADVSHELTTPVTAMRGYLETLAMPELAHDELTRARYLGIIGDETHRLERIIGDLLDLARLEGGGGALSVDDVAVADLFSRVVARHEPACRAANVAIVTRIEAGAEIVKGDRDRLEQALQNLAANALRFAPSGTAIELSARDEGDDVNLAVADQGPGIAAEHLPHVFDRFYKAESSRAARPGHGPSGSGLGLSIVKAIVERHGGRVSVTSAPGRTTFDVRIPKKDAGTALV